MSAPRIAVITGAGSGIGRAAAIDLAACGHAVVLAGRRREPLEETAARIEGASLVVPTDVSEAASVDRLFAQTLEHWGRVDLLFNNAGAALPSTRLRRDRRRGLGPPRRGQPDRRVPVPARGLPGHARPGSARWADHQ